MSGQEPTWVAPGQVHGLNRIISTAAGVEYHLKDQGLLESACARPAHAWFYDGQEDVFELALILMMAIVRNHAFSDGNKRAAFEAALLFLELNGFEVIMEDDVAFADLLCMAIAREIAERELIPWLRQAVDRDVGVQPGSLRGDDDV